MTLAKFRHIHITLILVAFCLAWVKCQPFVGDSPAAGRQANSLLAADLDSSDGDQNLDKRVERYAFGLGRRAYTYTAGGGAGVKRLPVYNFGLGKRARPYSFGLGKRSDFDDEYVDYGRNSVDSIYDGIKRNRPYSFGLGKRSDDEVERRAYPQRYGFGLGKR